MEEYFITPRVYWAEDKENVWLTIEVSDVKNETVLFQEDKVVFNGTRGVDNVKCKLELVLYSKIDSELSTKKITPRNIFLVLKKKESSFWNRLLKTKEKNNFLFVDFSRWKDEDEDEEQFDYSKLAEQFGGVNENDKHEDDEESDGEESNDEESNEGNVDSKNDDNEKVKL